MQTQKARNGSPDVPKKVSPRAARPLKITGLDPDSSSPVPASHRATPKDKSPKFPDRRSPRSPVSEKRRPSRIAELESQVLHLQEELKKAKEHLTLSETSKKQAEQEAEDSKKQLLQVSSARDEILKVSASEEETGCVLESRGFSREPDLHSNGEERKFTVDETAALGAAVREIRQFKLQIEMVASSGAGQVKQAELLSSEIQLLRGNLMETLFLVENFKNQLRDCEVSEAETEALTTETLRQLENAKRTVESLRSDGTKAIESYRKMALDLEQSRSRMELLEELVSRLQAGSGHVDGGGSNELEEEVLRLRAALDGAEKEHRDSSLEISSRLKIQAELQSELKMVKSEIEELKQNLMDKETELQFISEENENLCRELQKTRVEAELKKLRETVENLKADLMDKETELQNINDENESLKLEVGKKDRDGQDSLLKLGLAMEEADKSSKRAARVTEQLEAAQASNSEMETELRKLKVQSDQWRKAAEAATAMLSAGNKGKFVEDYSQTNSPYSEEIDNDLVKKKNPNVLKKIGVLWKKPEK